MIITASKDSIIFVGLHTLMDYPSRYNPFCNGIITSKLKQDEEFMSDYLFDVFKYCCSSEELYELTALDDLYVLEEWFVPIRDIEISSIVNRTNKFIDLVYYYRGLKIL